MERIRGDNIINRLVSFGSDSIEVTILVDIRFDITFISERIMKQFKNPNIRKVFKITIRFINGVVTRSNRVLRIKL
jgi:hypothetical protein